MIAIIDYGMGNSASILNMIQRVGGEGVITSDRQDLLNASAIILPGVGAFDNAINKLRSLELIDILQKRLVIDKVPFLGICLGMQLLFESSEEGTEAGLGILPGQVKRFSGSPFSSGKLKIPHMGWNLIAPTRAEHSLFQDLSSESRFYFTHSYYVECGMEYVSATCDYGGPFTCAIQKESMHAVQFHPEKSHKFGMQLFRNFLNQLSPC